MYEDQIGGSGSRATLLILLLLFSLPSLAAVAVMSWISFGWFLDAQERLDSWPQARETLQADPQALSDVFSKASKAQQDLAVLPEALSGCSLAYFGLLLFFAVGATLVAAPRKKLVCQTVVPLSAILLFPLAVGWHGESLLLNDELLMPGALTDPITALDQMERLFSILQYSALAISVLLLAIGILLSVVTVGTIRVLRSGDSWIRDPRLGFGRLSGWLLLCAITGALGAWIQGDRASSKKLEVEWEIQAAHDQLSALEPISSQVANFMTKKREFFRLIDEFNKSPRSLMASLWTLRSLQSSLEDGIVIDRLIIEDDWIELVGRADSPLIEEHFQHALRSASKLSSTSVSVEPAAESFRIRIERDAAIEAEKRHSGDGEYEL